MRVLPPPSGEEFGLFSYFLGVGPKSQNLKKLEVFMVLIWF